MTPNEYDLLKKYLRYVAEYEGVTFLQNGQGEEFSDEEWALLVKLDEESHAEWQAAREARLKALKE